MRTCIAIACAMMLGGCAIQQYPNLQTALQTWGGSKIQANYGGNDRSKLINCGTWATIQDIPPDDQRLMLSYINGTPLTPQVDDLYLKWIGFRASEPPPRHYVNRDATDRIERNFKKTCPELAEKYPDFLWGS